MQKIKLLMLVSAIAFLGAACTPGVGGVAGDGGVWFSLNRGERWEKKVLIHADGASRQTINSLDFHKLVFSPQDSRKIFALSAQGGLWISWNAGNNWDLIISASGVNDIAIHPTQPRTFYVAVGASIAKTESDGDVFKAVYTNDQKLNEVASLALHPAKPDIMYAGISGRGLAKSTDKGKNWKFFEASEFRDFVLIPTGIIYASRHGLLRSLNQGQDWVNLPLISDKNDSNIYSLAVNPKNPLEIFYGTRSTFYRSLDGGFNWIPRSLPTTRASLSILINPDNQDMIYLGVGRVR